MRTALFATILLTFACSRPAPVEQKSYTFHGRVEAVDAQTRRLKISGEKVDGWMDAMTMDYQVDNPSVLEKLKPGDQIRATVYDADEQLHNVQVVDAVEPTK
jgi:Cu/Ag efflux protein CusF